MMEEKLFFSKKKIAGGDCCDGRRLVVGSLSASMFRGISGNNTMCCCIDVKYVRVFGKRMI